MFYYNYLQIAARALKVLETGLEELVGVIS
jgi:hypothetical protein